MKTKILLVCGAVLLGGCAGVYDESAVPSASAAMQLAADRCEADRVANILKNNVELVDCRMAAERGFVVSVKLKKMDVFEVYASRMHMMAVDRDAGRITLEQTKARAAQIRNDYTNAIDNAVANDARERAQIAAGLAAMGESMQQEADRQAYIQAHNPTINCTSSAFGSTVNTTCH